MANPWKGELVSGISLQNRWM